MLSSSGCEPEYRCLGQLQSLGTAQKEELNRMNNPIRSSDDKPPVKIPRQLPRGRQIPRPRTGGQ